MGLVYWASFVCYVFVILAFSHGEDVFEEWHVEINNTIKPLTMDQPVITVNGLFPGPLLNVTTNDNVHINVFNDMDEPLLMTWNGIQQRLNSWQDGVSGTNCQIQPKTNWTYVFQVKDQIGTFSYFPSTGFHKAGGGYGPIRVNNRIVIDVPFSKPEAQFDLLIGDWYQRSFKNKAQVDNIAENMQQDIRSELNNSYMAYDGPPDRILINGKGPYGDPLATTHESFNFTKGKTYLLRISNVGIVWSINFRIQNHQMVLVETEGSYTNQLTLDSLDVHVGQSYSVLVTADQDTADYYIVATPKMVNVAHHSPLEAIAVLHYENSTSNPTGQIPRGPDPFDMGFSLNQAKSIRWNLTTGASRPNPQGTFNVTNVTLSQTFIINANIAQINGAPRYTVNNVSYLIPSTPLKLADFVNNGTGVYELDKFPIYADYPSAVNGTFVQSGNHKGWVEIVFTNELQVLDSWHLDGFGFYVVGFGNGKWNPGLRSTYNLYDPVVRSTVQVYPGAWSAVYAYLDNPGMWNLRSQKLKNWYLGQELYVRVYDADPNPIKEKPPPQNLLYCGKIDPPPPPPRSPPPSPPLPPSPPSSPQPVPVPPPGSPSSGAATSLVKWFQILLLCTLLVL